MKKEALAKVARLLGSEKLEATEMQEVTNLLEVTGIRTMAPSLRKYTIHLTFIWYRDKEDYIMGVLRDYKNYKPPGESQNETVEKMFRMIA